MKSTRIITHNGDFHCDDVFAVAIIMRMLKKEDAAANVDVIRTRDEAEIAKGDYVVDVGGVYDEARKRFDHHQVGGAGARTGANKIPFASCGLVWNTYGRMLCDSETVFEVVDRKLITPIDAIDNGVSISASLIEGVRPYSIQTIFDAFTPTWKEESSVDEAFMKCVALAETILEREIILARDEEEGGREVEKIFQHAPDKRLIILDKQYPWEFVLSKHPEPLYVVYQDKVSSKWRLKAIRNSPDTFENRKDLPESWAGKRGKELQEATGVADAFFCHTKRFIAVADSKEGILVLAQQALAA